MIKKLTKYLLSILLGLGGIYLFIAEIRGNFYQIDKDAYRSGILRSYNLPYYLKKYQIKTILNLQGESDKAWYANEIKLSKTYHIKHIDYRISNKHYYDYNQTAHIVKLLRESPKPILIHCVGGADRTSMVAALYLYAVKGKSFLEAKKQLSWYYGHLPQLSIRKHVIAMDRSFENYVKIEKRLTNSTL
jgi:protein tyrosine/serine phosphatase